jgi:hypothetical protein
MAKKSRADIMEKLSALKPSEPTRTRGKASRTPAAKAAAAKKAAPPKASGRSAPARKPKAQPAPNRPVPASVEILMPGFGGAAIFGDASKTVQGFIASWFQIIRNCSGAAADCNEMFLRGLSCFVNPGRWWRL